MTSTAALLLEAAKKGDEQHCRELLEGGVDPMTVDEAGSTALHLAVKTGKVGLVEMLLAAGIPLDHRNHDQVTPLHWAAARVKPEVVRLLVARGADIHAVERDGWTPLHWAAFRGDTATAELLIQQGARVNEVDKDGWTPLHLATQQGYPEVVKALLAGGADEEPRTEDGLTAFDLAMQRERTDVQVLLRPRPEQAAAPFPRVADLKDLEFSLQSDFIELNKLIKACGLVASGAMAAEAILGGRVKVDGQVELTKRRKIRPGQTVIYAGMRISVMGG